LNEGKVVGSEPVVARRHPTTLFDPVEEPLDLVASAVEIGAEAVLLKHQLLSRLFGVNRNRYAQRVLFRV
jgi:hypothetical protein